MHTQIKKLKTEKILLLAYILILDGFQGTDLDLPGLRLCGRSVLEFFGLKSEKNRFTPPPHSSLFLDIKSRIIFVPYARATHNLVLAFWIFENLVPKIFYEPSKMTHFSEIFDFIEIFNFLKSILGPFLCSPRYKGIQEWVDWALRVIP